MIESDEISPEERVPGEMTPEEQVDEWVKGNLIHNNNRYYRVVDKDDKVTAVKKMQGGECCPDFSCCDARLLWPQELRDKFKSSDEKTRSEMLGMALGALLNSSLPEVNVHIAGNSPTDTTH